MNVLVLNAGSSSLKSSLFELLDGQNYRQDSSQDLLSLQLKLLWQEEVDWHDSQSGSSFKNAANKLLQSLWSGKNAPLASAADINIIGHRVVHGGAKYTASTLINAQVLDDLRALFPLAPKHEPINVQGIEIAKEVFKDIPQVAVFDTAFHSSMPETAIVYPGPYEWYEKLGIRRFGFHGISHQSAAKRAAQILGVQLSSFKMITCHIGSGASLCAIKNGKSIMTTMGYTPLEGLVMSTRSGSIDPGIILYLLENKIYSASEISQLLNNESGLKGISGITSDMREIQNLAKSGNKRAQLAFDIYINHLASQIASLIPALGGLDTLVFTGGVGQNSSIVRAAVCEQLKCFGVNLDLDKNNSCENDMDISTGDCAVKTLVVQAKEELAIATECLQFLEK